MLRRLPTRVRRRVGRPFGLFKRMPGVRKMWSKGYGVTEAELREFHSAMDRHDGLFYLAAGAGFVADHKAQGDRLDFGQLFEAYRDQFPFTPRDFLNLGLGSRDAVDRTLFRHARGGTIRNLTRGLYDFCNQAL